VTFPRYSSYRDSGVEWLGELPSHWDRMKLSRVVDPRRPITYGIVQAGPDIEGGVPYIRPADMSDEGGVLATSLLLRTSLDIAQAYRRSTVRPGDIVCSIGPSFGKVMIVPDALDGANLTQGTARIAVSDRACARYMFWALRSASSVRQWESSVGGATFRALNLEPLASTIIAYPPLKEQEAIAAFLDREVAKIDALVGEQRRLIELLKEKRQAVISHVTINSSLEGHSNWQVCSLRQLLAEPLKNGISPDVSGGGETPTFSTAAVKNGVVSVWEHLKYTELDDARRSAFSVRRGDLLMVRGSGSKEFVGSVGEVREEPPTGCIYPDILIRLRLNPKIRPRYFLYSVRSHFVRSQLEQIAQTSAGIWKVSGTNLRTIKFHVPSLDVQRAVEQALDAAISKFDALIEAAEEAEVLLQERRTALISATVTGQIDVRQASTANHTIEADQAA
jgi:type I restriction enzyme S subunit